MAPFIPDGTYKIRNVEYNKYVADIINGIPHGSISGYTENPSNRNDKWKIVNQGGGGNQITIQSVSTGTYADANQIAGSSLVGSDNHTVWTVVKISATEPKYYIQSPDAEYVWELPQGANYVPIVLVKHTAKNDTVWTFDKV